MRTISRRLLRLEEHFATQRTEQGLSLADLVRARRRRRLEASGEPFEERPERLADDQNWPLSVADVLRMASARREFVKATVRIAFVKVPGKPFHHLEVRADWVLGTIGCGEPSGRSVASWHPPSA